MQDEMWKPITGYEGKYEISNYGRIKNLPFIYISGKIQRSGNRTVREVKPSIRKTTIAPNGYENVGLRKDGKYKGFSVHTLVWDMFGDAPRLYPLQIDHIDGNKLNNHIDNLQLTTPKFNRRKSINRDLPIGVVRHGNKYQSQITKNGKGSFLGLFDTPEEAHQKYLWAEKNL